jgi:PAS domain S-box-containing protein
MDIKEKEFISGLTRMGLTQYEARIYTTLTSNGILSAKELSDICGIPYGKTYEVINSLAKKGFVVVLPVKPMKYKAMDCQEVLKMLKTDLFKNFESAEGVMDSMKSMQKQDSANESKGSFWVLHGRGAINQKIEGLIKNSKKTLIMFLPGNVHFRIGYFAELLKIKKAEGIDISVLATKRIDSKLCSELGCSIVSDINQPLKSSFISADSTESLIFEAIPDDTNYTEGVDTGISILESSTTTFLEAMYSMFKNYKSLLMENDDVLFITDYKTHNILELNQKAEDIIGLPREEIIGKNLRSLPHFSEKFKHLFTEVSKELSTKKALNFNNLEIELNGKKIICQ